MNNLLQNMNPVLQLLPFVFVCMTSFLRYSIVFSFLKQALGTQQLPPSMVLIGLSIILTFYTMGPVFQQMWDLGSVPYNKSGNLVMAVTEGAKPLKEFMMK